MRTQAGYSHTAADRRVIIAAMIRIADAAEGLTTAVRTDNRDESVIRSRLAGNALRDALSILPSGGALYGNAGTDAVSAMRENLDGSMHDLTAAKSLADYPDGYRTAALAASNIAEAVDIVCTAVCDRFPDGSPDDELAESVGRAFSAMDGLGMALDAATTRARKARRMAYVPSDGTATDRQPGE